MDMIKKIDKIFQIWIDNPGAGGQLLVTHKGKVIVDRCYGYANIETQTPMTQDSVFHVASVSKQFAAMAILMLHDQGKLNVFDDVRKYIPDLIKFPEPVTIKQMMNHTSGIREHYVMFRLQGLSGEDKILQKQIVRLDGNQKQLNYTPGEEFVYSNSNYVFLVTIVERLTGMSFPQFAKKYIFEPLGMTSSFFRDDPNMLIPNRVSSYLDDGYTYTNGIFNIGVYGDSSLNTNCRDLTKFIQQYQNPTLISRETMENIMFHVPQVKRGTTIYAGGVRIQDFLGYRTIHHGGVNSGFRTFGILFPDEDLIVTVFTNTYNIPIETAGRDVARVILGLPDRKPPTLDEFKTDTVDWDSIEGFYYCDKDGDNYRITVKDGVVYHGSTPLVHQGGNLFKQGRLNISFAFGEDTTVCENGVIKHLRKFDTQVPEALARECEGFYFSEELEAFYTVVYEDGKLWLDHLRHGRSELHWLEGESFFTGMSRYRFFRNEDGKIDSYTHTHHQVRNLRFVKVC